MYVNDNEVWPKTISIIGAAGLVGSTVAAQLVLNGIGQQLYLQDRKTNVLEAHRIDLNDAKTIHSIETPNLHLGGPPKNTVDVLIIAASITEFADGDRRAFLSGNAQILNSLGPEIKRQLRDDGIVLLLSNPVDVLAHWLCSAIELDASRVFGYTLNDTARFQAAVARELGVPASEVSGVVYGEHGKGQVPIMSNIRVKGQKIVLDPQSQRQILEDIDGWFERWSQLRSGRSSGWATGSGTVQLIKQLISGQSTVATAYTGSISSLNDTFMALPIRREGGVVKIEDLAVSEEEFAQLQASAASIGNTAKGIVLKD